MKSFLYLLLLCSLFTSPVLAQIGMGGTPHPSAVLDLKATDKAFYLPRLTTAQRKAIVNPQPGAFVFDTEKSTFYLFDGQNWLPLAFQNPASLAPIDRIPDDGATGDQFGISVAISGDYALVGAPYDDIGANVDQGSAYVFERIGGIWTQQAKLVASNGAATDRFGISVSLSGDYALIGAAEDDVNANTDQGSAYVFVKGRPTWTQQFRLSAGDGTANDLFGYSVSISGDYALVGAYWNNIGASNNQGSAYVFFRTGTTWTQQAKLTANDGGANDDFGYSVSLSDGYALVGAPYYELGTPTNRGAAYVFVRSGTTWSQQATLTASDGEADDHFGNSVSISGDRALVGAYEDDIGANIDQGSAYVFARTGTAWFQQAKLTAFDGASGDNFGSSVSLSGDYALVGADSDDIGGNFGQGSGYVYKRTNATWSFVRAVVDNAPAQTRNGSSVGFSDDNFIIGGSSFDNGKGKVAFGAVDN